MAKLVDPPMYPALFFLAPITSQKFHPYFPQAEVESLVFKRRSTENFNLPYSSAPSFYFHKARQCACKSIQLQLRYCTPSTFPV